jgi:hypothetical protein
VPGAEKCKTAKIKNKKERLQGVFRYQYTILSQKNHP